MAAELFEKHLTTHALEPVNVDSHARTVTEAGLTVAAADLFDVAQNQVTVLHTLHFLGFSPSGGPGGVLLFINLCSSPHPRVRLTLVGWFAVRIFVSDVDLTNANSGCATFRASFDLV